MRYHARYITRTSQALQGGCSGCRANSCAAIPTDIHSAGFRLSDAHAGALSDTPIHLTDPSTASLPQAERSTEYACRCTLRVVFCVAHMRYPPCAEHTRSPRSEVLCQTVSANFSKKTRNSGACASRVRLDMLVYVSYTTCKRHLPLLVPDCGGQAQ